jgi:hypothetical protein
MLNAEMSGKTITCSSVDSTKVFVDNNGIITSDLKSLKTAEGEAKNLRKVQQFTDGLHPPYILSSAKRRKPSWKMGYFPLDFFSLNLYVI